MQHYSDPGTFRDGLSDWQQLASLRNWVILVAALANRRKKESKLPKDATYNKELFENAPPYMII